ncbi:hypothetical protein GCM10023165_50460 [Variovorax defluvii]|uniref:Type III secretion system chaperone n=1 Tax=Variovorax defluvii TaxID=913761 RepID=A0ABP8IE98_9BURK
MSAIESLLGPRPGPTTANPAPRTLLLGDDVLIHLHEDEHRETVVLYSVPGRADQATWLDELEESWSCVLRHPGHEEATAALIIEPSTRQVFLADSWPRAALDFVTLGQQLMAHAQRHRMWRAELEASHVL